MGALVIRTLIIYFSLMIVIRISGKRQVGQLDVSEFVSTILLSEIACLPIDDPDIPILYAMIPISFIICLEVILTYLKNKSSLLKKIFESSILVSERINIIRFIFKQYIRQLKRLVLSYSVITKNCERTVRVYAGAFMASETVEQ